MIGLLPPGENHRDWLDFAVPCREASTGRYVNTPKINGFMGTKIKTHKGTKKRFRLTAKGKAMHRQSGTSHLAGGLTKKRRRNLRGTAAVDTCMEKTIHAALNGNSY
ncbi:50S ribosomal protein L35 [Stieleria bergensis]|uniref:Large ribosomal subunit protein bL35 n=2 Tax=Stieleria bergensis TaxID=2528025 RepID=A0A517SYU1_9BACT|nr:50S ribosomal protein L35 [Planctomycetes bacterium SV_7m_r]